MKIIFLDIDGVLNSQLHFENDEYRIYCETFKKGQQLNYSKELDPICVNYLKEIVLKINAKIVVSSTWRSRMEDVHEALTNRGFDTSCIIDRTPFDRCPNCYRGNQIQKWLKDNEEVYGCEYYIQKLCYFR